jgi:hypothetical protein
VQYTKTLFQFEWITLYICQIKVQLKNEDDHT